MQRSTPRSEQPTTNSANREVGLATRNRGKLLVLVFGTYLLLYLSYRLVRPIFPALVWASAVAVISHPWLLRIQRSIKRPGVAAAVTVAAVALTIFVPIAALATYGAVQIGNTIGQWQTPEFTEQLGTWLGDNPYLARGWGWISENLDVADEVRQLGNRIRESAVTVVSGTIYTVIQTLLTLFILFYLYRDQPVVIDAIRQTSPLHDYETNELLKRLNDTVHATVYGIFVVALVQGALGGFMFWMLGIPFSVFWGIVMGLLAIVPYLGAFVVWVPAAIFLMIQGDWGKGLLLIAWGSIVIGLIDNLLYPVLVGDRLRLHTLVAFVAIVGGVAVFGAMGVILGPVVVTATLYMLEVWRDRTRRGAAAEQS